MIGFIYVFTQLVQLFLSALQLLMMVRAILSWIPMDEETKLHRFVYMMTEPVIAPIRVLLDRFEALDDLPFDISFLVSFFLLSIIQMLLPTVG